MAAGIGNLAVRRLHPDLWAGSLLVFVAALIVLAGAQARFDLLFFLVLPFIAVTHEGARLALWLAAAADDVHRGRRPSLPPRSTRRRSRSTRCC